MILQNWLSITSLQQLNFSYDWENTPSHIITNGVAKDGTRLIVLLLRDYVALTNEKVNPSCPTCLNNYINFIKSKYMSKENKNESAFVLKAKYEGIVLEFGSPVYVDNDNITDEYGLILLNRFLELGTPPENIFSKFPDEYKTVVPEVKETKVVKIDKDSKETKSTKATEKEKTKNPEPTEATKDVKDVEVEKTETVETTDTDKKGDDDDIIIVE